MKGFLWGWFDKLTRLVLNSSRKLAGFLPLRLSCFLRIHQAPAISLSPEKSTKLYKTPSLPVGVQLKRSGVGQYNLIALILFFGGLITLTISGMLLFRQGISGLEQPLPFNHRVHAENGMECSDCHQLYREHPASGKPTLEVCSGCHSEPIGQSQSEKLLLEYILNREEIPWKRIYRLPPDVYFSHRRHVRLGKVECQTCHGNIGQSSSPPSQPLKISMKKCMKCHEQEKVDNDCLACHR